MIETDVYSKDHLRTLILASLEEQGFEVRNGQIVYSGAIDKRALRELHTISVQHRQERARRGLQRFERTLLSRIADGNEIVLSRIAPQLVEVLPESEDELLFRFASLHWSIPVSSGYGRRLRYLVIDSNNEKLVGILGLGDPVFRLGDRDRWIGWTPSQIKENLHQVMDAFVLGAVPPYSSLLCGKLIAMLASSVEVTQAFNRKYSDRRTVIRGRDTNGQLALITTTSALGRSSLYNRLKFRDRPLYYHCGYTMGSGEFHFSNGLYRAISAFVRANATPTAKQERWGNGFRNRREVIRKCLIELGLPRDLLYHGVQREIFALPLAHNTREYLRDEALALQPFSQTTEELYQWFQERWMLPRASRDSTYLAYKRSAFALWT